MTQRKYTLLDKIGNLIPGYNGYANREEKRNSDKKFRDQLALEIQNDENLIISYQKVLIAEQEMNTCTEWEIARKSLNTLYSKIKNTSYGASSFFSENQLKEEELEEIYTFDLEIAERITLISKTVQEDQSEVLSPVHVLNQIKEIDKILTNRSNYINQHK